MRISQFVPRALLLAALAWPSVAGAKPTVVLEPSVKAPKPGQKLDLAFKVVEDGQPLTSFDTVHEKTSHLMLISADYTDYQHIHPELDAKGNFVMRDVTFRRPGLYYIFFDVTPQGSDQIVKRFDFKVQGQGAPLVLKEDLRDRGAEGVRIHLMPMPMPLKTGDAMLHFQLTRNGEPVTNIKPLMGAMGHVVALGKGGEPYLHIHPLEGGGHEGMSGMSGHGGHDMSGMKMDPADGKPGEVAFHARFPKPGLYQIWGQFAVGDVVIIAPFTVRVQ